MNHPVRSKTDLIEIFSKVGVDQGMNLMVHSSMKSLGYIVNGALDVIDSLTELVGEKGTILMPSHSGQLTDPADWKIGDFSFADKDIISKNMAPFNPRLTQIRNRGEIPRVFLMYPNVFRSQHPINSVSARGKMAKYFTSLHDLNDSEGENSPVGRLYEKNGHVLLIGVDLSRCSAIHLAEFKSDVPYLKDSKMKVLLDNVNRTPRFIELTRYPGDSSGFTRVQKEQEVDFFNTVKLEGGVITLFRLKPVIDYIMSKLAQNPMYLREDF